MKVLLVVLLLACLAPSPVQAETSRGWFATGQLVLADLVVARPLALVQLATGVVLLPVLYPHAWLSRIEIDLIEICVREPGRDAFTRPLGELASAR